MTKFDILVLNQIHNAFQFFTGSDFYNGTLVRFGIKDFNLPLIIILLVSGQYFAKWIDIKMKMGGQFSNKIKKTVNEKPVLIVGGAILLILGIML